MSVPRDREWDVPEDPEEGVVDGYPGQSESVLGVVSDSEELDGEVIVGGTPEVLVWSGRPPSPLPHMTLRREED